MSPPPLKTEFKLLIWNIKKKKTIDLNSMT